jgi:hypothetical protein
MTAATVIDAVPNNEVTYAEIDTADNRSQDVAVNAGQDEDRGSMDEA